MGKRNATFITVIDETPVISSYESIFGKTCEAEWQISATAYNASGEKITPISARLVVKIKPRGANEFIEADKDLDLSTGEFYRPFSLVPSAFSLQLFDKSPEVERVEVALHII